MRKPKLHDDRIKVSQTDILLLKNLIEQFNDVAKIEPSAQDLIKKTEEITKLASELRVISRSQMKYNNLWASGSRIIPGRPVETRQFHSEDKPPTINQKDVITFCKDAVDHVSKHCIELIMEFSGQKFTLPIYPNSGWRPCKIVPT